MKYLVDFIGCEKRKLDAQRVIDHISSNGGQITEEVERADVIIVVTCAYTHTFEDASLVKVKELNNKKKEGAKLIIGGCLPSIDSSKLDDLGDLGVFSPRSMEDLDQYLNLPTSIIDTPDPNKTIYDHREWTKIHEDFKTPALEEYETAKKGFKIKINSGCLGNCSYCVIKKATGKLRSKPLDHIIEEFKLGLSKGEEIFFITGGDTGAWGMDDHSNIVNLLTEIFKIDGEYKLFFHDFNIHWFIRSRDEVLELFSHNRAHLGCICLPVNQVVIRS